MRRLAAILILVLGAVFAVVGTGAGDGESGSRSYKAELDNAFGLVTGGDLKVAGVRAGKVTDLDLDPETNRAIVTFEVTETGFGSLRTDVTCEARPQSLIGEYFLDCLPGTAKAELPPGSTIPVARTVSTIPGDLVNNVLRRPYRERLAIILGELGAGVAGNGKNLNDAIRRASPALRETNKVLRTLAKQNRILADLARDADVVVGDLASNRKDVGRFVLEARDTAAASAERRDAIAAGFRKLPGFLAELQPTMKALGETADAQTPALRNLQASAKQLERLVGNLGPLAKSSRPAISSLGKASDTGRGALSAAKSTVEELDRFSEKAPEVGNNLRFVLEHLDDREHGVEDDPRSPGGKGYTGFEALLTYVFDQVMSVNIYDQNAHVLNISLIPPNDPCAGYADVARAKDPETKDCPSILGPNQPGINFFDPSAGDPSPAQVRRRVEGELAPEARKPVPAHALPYEEQKPADAEKPKRPSIDVPLPVPSVELPPLPGLPDVKIGSGKGLPETGLRSESPEARDAFLNYLFTK
ncbi:MlaD family protein [Paraconexibacter sp.]|uniref:MlaD family protein n=1 Tax=Paraconexibacter sp. TaxID=2949640 RepID=UPI0035695B9E